MVDEITELKQLQADLNASFDAIYAAKDARSLAQAKAALVGHGHATARLAAGGPAVLTSTVNGAVHFMAIRVAVELNIFEMVAEGPKTIEELAQRTKANPSVLKRILRLVNAQGFLRQKEADKWEATALTHTLTIPAFQSFVKMYDEKRLHMYAAYPTWLKEHNYQTGRASEEDNVAMTIYGTSYWTYLRQHPELRHHFEMTMSMTEKYSPNTNPPYPFEEGFGMLKDDKDAITMVDIGGGRGQAIGSLKETYPGIPGKFIVQDLAMTIDFVDVDKARAAGFEPMSHDFFQPQPILGAKYYHMRRVLHDWSDEKALEILANTKVAMEPTKDYSKLLIHDFVVPDVNAGLWECTVDMVMLSLIGGAERSNSEWQALLGKAGFKIDKIWHANAGPVAVIEASIA